MKPHANAAKAKAPQAMPRTAGASRTASARPFSGFAFSSVRPFLVSSLIGLLIILPL